MPTFVSDTLLQELLATSDLDTFLKSQKASPIQIIKALRSARARRQIAARRELARIQSLLLAARYAPYALHRLCELLQKKEKPELRLRSAVSLLALAGVHTRAARKPGAKIKPTPANIAELDTAEARDLLTLMELTLTKQHTPNSE